MTESQQKQYKMMSRKFSGGGNPFFGKTHDPATCLKMRLSHLGKKLSAEQCRKIALSQLGSKHPRWKGGKYKNSAGYVFLLDKSHPCRNSNGYVREHRLVVEKQIGRILLPAEQVHHLGEIDDNRPHMLMAFKTDKAHKRFEHGLSVDEAQIIFDGRKLKEECNVSGN